MHLNEEHVQYEKLKAFLDGLPPAETALFYAHLGHMLTIAGRLAHLTVSKEPKRGRRHPITNAEILNLWTAFNEIAHGLTNHLVLRLGGHRWLRPTNAESIDMLMETAAHYGVEHYFKQALAHAASQYRADRAHAPALQVLPVEDVGAVVPSGASGNSVRQAEESSI